MKKLFLALFIVLLSASAFSMSIKPEKSSYGKGEEIIFSGSCDQGLQHSIKAESEGKQVFDSPIECQADKFVFIHQSTFLDPSGNWEVTLSTERSSAKTFVNVEPVPKSAYYRITFLSPAEFSFERGSDVFISADISDAGTPVVGADAIMYDVFGRRIQLRDEGNGVYDLNYLVPFDAPLGDWSLLVETQKGKGTEMSGGERNIATKIIPARFSFSIVEPRLQTYEESDQIPFKALITYGDGTPLDESKALRVELIADNQRHGLQSSGNGEWSTPYNPDSSGSKAFSISAEDSAGNLGETSVSLVITCPATCLLKKFGLPAIVIALVAGVVFRLFYSRTRSRVQLMRLKAEHEKTIDLIKSLQRDYFGKGVMPTSSYRTNLAMYKSRLIELEQQIKRLDATIESEK